MKWFIVENRSGSFSCRLRASSQDAALATARRFNPGVEFVVVREETPATVTV